MGAIQPADFESTKAVIVDEAIAWPERARALRIADAQTYTEAAEMLLGIKALRKQIAETFDPNIKRWYEGHRAAVREKQEAEAPLAEAEAVIKRSMSAWDAEQERLRRIEEQRLAAEARRREEARRLEMAAALEQQAVATGDAALLAEALDAIDTPATAPVVTLPRATPRVAGISYREQWKAECVNLGELVRAAAGNPQLLALLQPNTVAINQMARALKGQLRVPGVRVWSDRQVAAGGRA